VVQAAAIAVMALSKGHESSLAELDAKPDGT
jgi:hypothetical protein